MDWLGWMIAGACLLCAVCYVLSRKLLPTEARQQIVNILFAGLRRKPIETPPPPEPSKPDAPAALQGNVRPIQSEWEKDADVEHAFLFPKMDKPVTRFEDLNRRLIVFTPGTARLPGGKLPPRNFDDYPLTLKCSAEEMRNALWSQLRCAYPVIFDSHGHFAECSRTLELNPAHETPLLLHYLKIPEDQRPIIISQTVAPKDSSPGLTLSRYGFNPITIPFTSLGSYVDDNLTYLFEAFLGQPEDWMWFSIARLRAHGYEKNKPQEEAKAEVAKLLYRNRFAQLWGLRDETPEPEAAAATPNRTEAHEENVKPADATQPTEETEGEPA